MSQVIPKRIGFVSTRVSGTDGVSLEIRKWTHVLERLGFDCYFVTGPCDFPESRTFPIPEADFLNPEIRELNQNCFGNRRRTRETTRAIHELTTRIKLQLDEAVRTFNLDLLIAQNSLTIPLNIPLGVALVELLHETGMPCIAHHHDFAWERDRFLINSVEDYIHSAFPPPLAQIQHVVINSLASAEFSRRTGLSCRIVPNVMNFAHPPTPNSAAVEAFRQELGVSPDEKIILQPTRIVQRKGIEHSLELMRRLNDPACQLVISHDSRDEGSDYKQHLCELAEMLNVPIRFADHLIGAEADGTRGEKFSIWDVYPAADLVTYPSTQEGFGNAFLEAIYYRKPIFCNRYTIYRADIEPLGFRTILMDGFLTERVVEEARFIMDNPRARHAMVEHNYQLARVHFSFERLERELIGLLASMGLLRI